MSIQLQAKNSKELRVAEFCGTNETYEMFLFIVLLTCSLATQAAHWNQFRGPDGTGHSSAKLPIKWSETENIKWKTKIPGRGWSSPVIWENQIWLGR